ncbi:MAG: DNA polymerase III subunit delta [Oscillospiraceae bacterium]|nr:DNA polymerase III subunit delta [Oscillospiraceae bacterium]
MAKTAPDKGYQQLKSDLAAGTPGQVYIFHGEESYLREYYLGALRSALVPPEFESFNYHRLDGKGLTMAELTEAAEAMPMMAERTLVVVTDCDLFKLGEESRKTLVALLGDFPDYCCLVFVYDVLEYKPDKRLKSLCAALDERARVVRFDVQDKSDLVNWLRRRFRALGKDIDAHTAEHLIFTCGSLMTGLVPEVEKIAAYAKGSAITVADIDAVADPVLDAAAFQLTNAITRGDYNGASELLGQLLKKQEEPFLLLAAISKELRRLYTARLALDEGRGKLWLMELWGMRSDYPARLLLDAARRTTRAWCGNSLVLCQRLDRRMKSEKGVDDEGELKLLLMRLAQRDV